MALSAADFSNIKHTPLGPGRWMVTGTWTLPASYASGGEDLTTAILKATTRLNKIDAIIFTSKAGQITGSFDGVSTATSQGKLHAFQAGLAGHTHDIKAIGGLTSSEALFLDASQSFGKTAATDRTIVGATSATTGGVVAAAAVNSATEVVAAQNLSANTLNFVMYGS